MTNARGTIVLLVACLALAMSTQAEAIQPDSQPEELLEIDVSSGRTFIGEIDATTTSQALVLRFGSRHAWVQRSIRWSSIVAARHGGQAVPTDELPKLARRLATPAPEVELANGNEELPNAVLPAVYEQQTVYKLPPQVKSLAFDAVLANWDADVETDGLVIYLQPIDDWGQLTAASGTVEMELFAPQRRTLHHAPMSGGISLELLSRWTTTVNEWQFTPSGAVLKFPFAAYHPEFHDDWGWRGLVHIRLTVPGSGVFEASADAVRIRPWAPLRDALQLNTSRRFVPTERTGRSKTSYSGGE